MTPLHAAAYQGHLAVTEMLLDHKADPGIHDTYDRETPLHMAAFHGHPVVAQLTEIHHVGTKESKS